MRKKNEAIHENETDDITFNEVMEQGAEIDKVMEQGAGIDDVMGTNSSSIYYQYWCLILTFYVMDISEILANLPQLFTNMVESRDPCIATLTLFGIRLQEKSQNLECLTLPLQKLLTNNLQGGGKLLPSL